MYYDPLEEPFQNDQESEEELERLLENNQNETVDYYQCLNLQKTVFSFIYLN